jgi:cellobiose-specific phosphotransferase system component IIC
VDGLFAVLVGLGLAAAAGFRVFVPLLAVGAAARFELLPLTDGFAWMASDAALITFGAATALEIAAYFVPWVDNLLDTLATPAAVLAGVVLTAAVMTDFDPAVRWTLAVVAGGGTAGVFQGLTAGTRGISSLATGGVTNFVVALLEAVASTLLAALAILVPVAAALVIAVLLALVARRTLFRRHPASA